MFAIYVAVFMSIPNKSYISTAQIICLLCDSSLALSSKSSVIHVQDKSLAWQKAQTSECWRNQVNL